MAYTTTRRRPRAVRPSTSDDDDYLFEEEERFKLPSFDVESEGPRNTGLLDHRGDTIWNVPDPIGFRFSEQE